MPATPSHLVAACTHCGAPLPLSLATATGACAHCGAQDPLPPSVRSAVDALRAKLAGRDEKTRQLTVSTVVEGDALHGVGLIALVICWVFFGGIAVYVALDHDVPMGRFLARGEPAQQWWLLWSFALGVSLSLALLEIAVARIRGLTVGALPAPPLSDSSQPRCRSCGAELPVGSALRRCTYCRTDNLVVTGRYLAAQSSVDDALAAMARSFDRDLRARIEAGDRVAMVGSVAPFFLLFIGPAVGLFVPGQASLWAVPGAVAALAALAAVWARVRRLPVEPLELLTIGQKVYVRDEPHPDRPVCAQLMAPTGIVHLLGPSLDDVELALATARVEGELTVVVYRVTRPSHPLGPREAEQLVPAELWVGSPEGGTRIERVAYLATRTGWRTFVGDAREPQLSGNVSGKPPTIVVV